MPKGVEHTDTEYALREILGVEGPLMPKGVEHLWVVQELIYGFE